MVLKLIIAAEPLIVCVILNILLMFSSVILLALSESRSISSSCSSISLVS